MTPFSWTPPSKCDILITEMEVFMSRKLFTEEQQQLLRQNPYIYSVTDTRIVLTKEFKEIFMAAYKAGEAPRKILENHGFDINIIGERRIWSISQRIRTEYHKYGEFHEGYCSRRTSNAQPASSDTDAAVSDADEIKQLKQISISRIANKNKSENITISRPNA